MRWREHGIYLDKHLYSLELDTLDDIPHQFSLASEHFACLLALDATKQSEEAIRTALGKLLDLGMSSLSAWGPDCELVHDLCDEIDWQKHHDEATGEDRTIMTVWHADESLEDALFSALYCPTPHEYHEQTTGSMIGISVANSHWSHEIREYLNDPHC